jgi:ketosteroid isomerase-like protein
MGCAAVLAAILAAGATQPARAQLPDPGSLGAATAPNPLTDSTVNSAKVLLYGLEAKFAQDVAAKGGAAFADWFAPDGVLLGNGQQPLIGLVAIEKSVNWAPGAYQLTWTPTDAVLSPAGDMGYTWGHFEGHSKDANGNPVVTTGRYMTIWRKQADGNWKVVLDAGANEPAESGDCCKLPDGD